MENALYINQGGQVACKDHGGQYLKSYLEAYPYDEEITTPLGHWVRATKEELDGLGCETCEPWF
jgi:hypothetical protein